MQKTSKCVQVMFYNNEQALRYVIKFAYIICIDYYLKVEELPTGKGIADVVFIPKRDTALPAMIVELKAFYGFSLFASMDVDENNTKFSSVE